MLPHSPWSPSVPPWCVLCCDWLPVLASPRPVVRLGLQRVPLLRAAGPPALRVPEDGEPVHRQGGAVRRGELHLRGDEQRHQGQSAELPHLSGPPVGR